MHSTQDTVFLHVKNREEKMFLDTVLDGVYDIHCMLQGGMIAKDANAAFYNVVQCNAEDEIQCITSIYR